MSDRAKLKVVEGYLDQRVIKLEDKLSERITEIQGELSELRAKGSIRIEELDKRVAKLGDRLSELISDIQGELSALRTASDVSAQVQHGLASQIAELRAEGDRVTKLEGKLTELAAYIGERDVALERIKRELAEPRAKGSIRIEELDQRVAKLGDRLSELRAENSRVGAELAELRADPDGFAARQRRNRAAQERLDRVAEQRRSAVTSDDASDDAGETAVVERMAQAMHAEVERMAHAEQAGRPWTALLPRERVGWRATARAGLAELRAKYGE